MSRGFKIKKFLLSFVTAMSVIITILAVLWMIVFHIYLVPKFGSVKIIVPTGRNVLQLTKYVINGKLVEDIKNFDKETAKDVLSVMLELEEEMGSEGENADKKIEEYILENQGKIDVKKIVPKAEVEKIIEDAGVSVGNKEQRAVNRILEAATKEEINLGMAILSKLDLAKLKKLHAANDKKGISNYLLSKLTRKEINAGVRLYEKYKHLL